MRCGGIIANTCKITFNQKPSTVEFLYRGLYTAFDNKHATSAQQALPNNEFDKCKTITVQTNN